MLDKIKANNHCKSQKNRVVILQEGFSLQRKIFFNNEGCCDLGLCCLDGLCGS